MSSYINNFQEVYDQIINSGGAADGGKAFVANFAKNRIEMGDDDKTKSSAEADLSMRERIFDRRRLQERNTNGQAAQKAFANQQRCLRRAKMG